MIRELYNLEFPSNCHEMVIDGYRFTRVDNYEGAVKKLQHLVSFTSEFQIDRSTGGHAITALVELPPKEKEAALAWGSPGEVMALSDIILLLSLFTQREVFCLDNSITRASNPVIIADSRVYPFGGILLTSVPRIEQWIDPEDPLSVYDAGLEKSLNQILELIRTEDWSARYERGYFLFLAQQVLRSDALDVAFTLCWTIWEHLFAVLNRKWMSSDTLRRMLLADKLAFLFVECGVKDAISKKNREQIIEWGKIRNHLVHERRFSENDSSNWLESSTGGDAKRMDMFSFVQLTEYILAKILGLSPNRATVYTGVTEFLES